MHEAPSMTRRLPSLHALQVFEVAGRHLSFTKAADELCLTQGAVSRQIAQLEAALGYTLFHRQVRRVSLTAQGEALLPHIGRAFAQLAKGLDAADGVRNVVRLKAPTCISRWLMPLVMAFREDYPDIDVEVTTVREHGVNFDAEGFDLAVVFGNAPAGEDELLLVREKLTPVCAPGLLTRIGKPLHATGDLPAYPLLHPSRDRRDWHMWLAAARDDPHRADSGQLFDTLDMAVQAASQGIGIAIGDVTLVADDLASGALVAPFALVQETGYRYALRYPAKTELRSEAKLMWEWFRGRNR